jgi:hypothetical protein
MAIPQHYSVVQDAKEQSGWNEKEKMDDKNKYQPHKDLSHTLERDPGRYGPWIRQHRARNSPGQERQRCNGA